MTRFFSLLLTFSLLFLVSCGSQKKASGNKKATPVKKHSKVEKASTSKGKTSKPISASSTTVAKNTANAKSYNRTTLDYINRFSDIAKNNMKKYRIPASITMAQAILESNSGKSTLSVGYNNHFGIKCHKEWTGERTYYDDDAKNECFRVYNDYEGSFKDHSEFLKSRMRYAHLFRYEVDDYYSWAYGLSKAGYATDSKYPQKLIGIIEKYKLYEFDQEVLERKKSKSKMAPDFHVVQEGETLQGLSDEFGVDIETIKHLNNLEDNSIYPNMKLYFVESRSPKNNTIVDTETNANAVVESIVEAPEVIETNTSNNNIHIVNAGESLYGISKQYDLTVDEIMKINQLSSHNLEIGQTLIISKEGMDNLDYINKVKEKTEKSTSHNTPQYHIVEKGDNLYNIAYRYNIETNTLKEINNITEDTVFLGQKLLISKEQGKGSSTNNNNTTTTTPVNKETTTPQENTSSTKATHTVEPGQTLYRVSVIYGISVEKLKELNNLSDNTIKVGQILRLK